MEKDLHGHEPLKTIEAVHYIEIGNLSDSIYIRMIIRGG
jgi:hypothetical protein